MRSYRIIDTMHVHLLNFRSGLNTRGAIVVSLSKHRVLSFQHIGVVWQDSRF
uniref:Uncharacterized protein n=1 Tax=Arundo donax TaxID=35708 RepID=A0A0A9H9V0_ARUDO